MSIYKLFEDENDENVSHLEITDVVLVHFNNAKNDYQHTSRALYTFVNKSFGPLLDISPKNFVVLKPLIQSFHVLKYVLLIKILNFYR